MHARPATIILGALLVVTGMVPDQLLASNQFSVGAQAPHWTYSTRQDSSVESVIVSYPITRNNLGPAASDLRSEDQRGHSLDDGKVRELWKYYTRLVPLIARKNLTTLDVFTDGSDKIAAAVYRDDNNEAKWHLAIDYQDAYDDDGAIDQEGMRDVLLHETGHMLTLSTEQVLVNYQQCPTYESDQGCSKTGSYINRFYDQFWKPHANDLSRTFGQGLDMQNTRDFYLQHENEFLTPYASTGVEEDMAETFAYFIQHGKPYGSSIADQKVRFFYGFSFFVRLRKIIRLGLES